MNGFITLAVGNEYLQRAAAFAISAQRFGYPTVLMVKDTDPGPYAGLFHRIVPLEHHFPVNTAKRAAIWEFKQFAYDCSPEFARGIFVDADSLVIRDPGELFALAEQLPIHTPGGRSVRDDEHWGVSPRYTTRELANGLGLPTERPLQTLNGGFLLWRRGKVAEHWFHEFRRNFNRVREFYAAHDDNSAVPDEICMSLAFAMLGIDLPRSNSSTGVWDAHDLRLDIAAEEFSCRKHYYWEGHYFEPFIAHFGGSSLSDNYRKCVRYLLADERVELPLFASSPLQTAPSGDYDFSHWNTLPKVSCQCITYGRPELLEEAVESFLRQDYPGEKELVVLNDHPEVLLELSGFPEVHVFNIPRRFRTIGEKRNACCGLCTGEVIVPWDDDDIHLPWRLSYSLQQMKNRQYFKPDKLWYWTEGKVSLRKAVAHAMGAWSKELFDKVGGYDHIQSGQDQTIETRFGDTDLRYVEDTPVENAFYIYRFPGTGSYHLSAHGFGKGFEEAKKFVDAKVPKGRYVLKPQWRADYVELVSQQMNLQSV